MKNFFCRKSFRWGAALACPFLVFVFMAVFAPVGQSIGPVLAGGPLSNGWFLVTITNGAPNGTYEIYEKYSLDPSVPWSGSITSSYAGQTSFWFYAGPAAISWFFKAVATNDLDGDGIPNYLDADPNDPSINVPLAITIISPTNNATLQ